MPAILVTYDLQTPGQKYTELHEKLKAYPNWASLMDSTWIVIGNFITPQGVSDDLRTVLDDNDLVFCVDITSRLRAGWLQQTTWDWINKYV